MIFNFFYKYQKSLSVENFSCISCMFSMQLILITLYLTWDIKLSDSSYFFYLYIIVFLDETVFKDGVVDR